MKKQYFYDLGTGSFVGGANGGKSCPDGCGVTEEKPENNMQLFSEVDVEWIDQGQDREVKKAPRQAVSYSLKVSGYNLTKTKSALRFVKNAEKKAILESHLESLSA